MTNSESQAEATERNVENEKSVDEQIRELVFAEAAKGRKIQDVIAEIEESLKIARMFQD